MNRGSVYRRCGGRDEAAGKLLGARCPGLRSQEYGSWYFSANLPSATGERHRVRGGGFATQDEASAALEALASRAAGPEPGLSTGEWLSCSTRTRPPSWPRTPGGRLAEAASPRTCVSSLFAAARSNLAELFVAMGFGVGSFSAAMPGVILAATPHSETSSAMSFNYVVRSVGTPWAAP